MGQPVAARVPASQKVNGEWVVYGMGNQLAKQNRLDGITEERLITRFHFTEGSQGWTVGRAEHTPTLIDFGPPIRVTVAPTQNTARAQRAVQRTDDVVLSRGASEHGSARQD